MDIICTTTMGGSLESDGEIEVRIAGSEGRVRIVDWSDLFSTSTIQNI